MDCRSSVSLISRTVRCALINQSRIGNTGRVASKDAGGIYLPSRVCARARPFEIPEGAADNRPFVGRLIYRPEADIVGTRSAWANRSILTWWLANRDERPGKRSGWRVFIMTTSEKIGSAFSLIISAVDNEIQTSVQFSFVRIILDIIVMNKIKLGHRNYIYSVS